MVVGRGCYDHAIATCTHSCSFNCHHRQYVITCFVAVRRWELVFCAQSKTKFLPSYNETKMCEEICVVVLALNITLLEGENPSKITSLDIRI